MARESKTKYLLMLSKYAQEGDMKIRSQAIKQGIENSGIRQNNW